MTLSYKTIDSPVGKLKLVASDKGLVAVLWDKEKPNRVRLGDVEKSQTHPVLIKAERQISEYFARKRRTFSVPIDVRGTSFQKQVWDALLAIPFGETRTYGDIARRLGKSQAARAVGAASGRNPISIIVPCHRVVGSSGKLTGFAGGLDAKTRLLELERRRDGRTVQSRPRSGRSLASGGKE
jgi:methylated-DNA-[protein]-cysteine S-methyltransferase